MIDVSRYQQAFASLPDSIQAAEVNAENVTKTALNIQGGTVADGQSGSVTKFYVRATAQQTGIAYSEKYDEVPADIIRRAVESVAYASDTPPQIMNPAGTLRLGKPSKTGSIEDAIQFGIRSEKLAGEIDTVESVIGCQVNLCSRKTHTVNSFGLDAVYEAHWLESILQVTMKRGGKHTPGYAYISAPSPDALDAEAFAAAAAADGNAYDGGGLPPYVLQSGSYPAVLSGRVMRNILMTAWMTLSGQAMLSGNSIFHRAQGTRIGSPALNMTNAPSHPMLGQAWLVDSEGTQIQPTRLVENGLLRTPLYTLASGNAAGMPSTGSAGRVARMTGSMPIALTTVPAILYVEPGAQTQDALIQSMGTGILLTYSLDLFHSVNVVSGEFSIPCGGVYYRDGHPVGSLSQLTVAGNLRDLFANIKSVANDLDFDNFYLETYTIGSPSALVQGLSFSS
ncbi:MAG TPA: metallopeptidase TldD-related protein [Candidatus Limiplasma sp.]|nr:metallopeptidase TldD-related protein [Candidatus Limiplasma sp.]